MMKIPYYQNRRLTAWATYIIVLLAQVSVSGQTTDNAVRVSGITATRFYMGRTDESGLNEYRYKLAYNRVLGDPANPACVQINTSLTGWHPYYDGVDFYNSFGEIITDPFVTYSQLHAEIWENDSDPECEYNSGDDMHCGPDLLTFRYIDYVPGIENTIEWEVCNNANSIFRVEYKFRYGIPKPSRPNLPDEGVICDNSARTLTTVTGISGGFNSPNYLFETVWEIQVGSGPWKYLGTAPVYADFSAPSPKSHINFDLRNHPDLANITAITTVNYRVKTRMTVVGGGVEVGSVFESVYTVPDRPINLGPKAPVIGTTSTAPSCASTATGTITLNVTGLGEYMYALKPGNDPTPCNPELDDCGARRGRFSGGTITIGNVAPGDYTVLITNKGGSAGICWDYELVTVGTYAALQSTVTSGNVSCFGSSDGFIRITGTGGNPPRTFRLTGNSVNLTNSTGNFENLRAGTYDASVIDACGEVVTKSVNITSPAELEVTFTSANGNCTSVANGNFSATVTQGAGTYTYQLYRNGTLIRDMSNTTNTTWTHSDLGAGQYTIRIYDLGVGSGQCYVTSTVDITQPSALALPASNIVVTDVACNGARGKIIVVNEAAAGMNYELRNLGTNQVTQPNVDLEFLNLDAGRYKVVKKRSVAGCGDVVESAELNISGAGTITIALAKTDVTCFGESNGSITATTTGGTPDDVYKWEINLGGNWIGLPLVGASVNQLAAGSYRVTVTTPDLCGGVSDVVIIEEPEQLQIGDIKITDVDCQGLGGTVRASALGGVMPYTYLFTSGTTEISSTTEDTSLPPGTYSLKLKDANNCEVVWPTPIELRSNGGPLVMELVAKEDVRCSGDSNGRIAVRIAGGVAPFVYTVNGIENTSGTEFTSLSPGTYSIRVEDRFGCSSEISAEVRVLGQPMDVTITSKDASCFGLADGSVKATVIGGVQPFTYDWSTNAQTPEIRNVGAGTYALRVTDQQGCTLVKDVEVAQPEQIAITVTSVPVCAGQPTGEINVAVAGGVEPFEYSINTDFGSVAKFTNVAAGNYTVRVRDAHACTSTSQTEVTVQNNKPEVDFIVASRETAQDTLVIHEISTPKPDRVEWTFGPGIIVLESNSSTAQVKVLSEGSYPITMTGNFDGCIYSKTSTLVFDPFDPDANPRLKGDDLLIKRMTVTPNPTNGPFNLIVELASKQWITVTIYDLIGTVKYQRVWERESALDELLALDSDLPVGIYIVRVVTNTDARQLQLVLAR